MAKMISKFHLLIQSKAVWIVFVALVVISFILLPVAAHFSGRSNAEKNAPGLLEGKPVPREEYMAARANAYLSLLLMSLAYGQDLQFNEQVRQYIDDIAWKRLATLRKAEEIGFEAFDEEVAEYIKSYPLFSPEGKFNPQIYAAFKQQILPTRGYSGADFERYAAEEVLLRKVQRMVAEAALVSPVKIESSLKLLRSEFRIDYAVLERDMVTNQVVLSEDDIRDYYESNSQAFVHPVQIDLKYVYIPYENYLDRIEKPGEAELQDYYNNNLDRFTIEQEKDADEDDSTAREYLSFDEARAEIEASLEMQRCRRLALDAANEMVFELPPDRNGKARDFDEVARELGLAVEDIPPYSVGAQPELADGASLVAREGDQLRPNQDEYFSDAIPCEDGVYVLALQERKPEFVQELDAVREQVAKLARLLKIQVALDEKAEELYGKFDAGLGQGGDFGKLAGREGLSVEKSEKFRLENVSEALPANLNPQMLAQEIVYLNQGELAKPIAVAEGRLLAYVAERGLADLETAGDMRAMIKRTLTQDRVQKLYDRWQTSLLDRADFEDRTQTGESR